MIFILATATTTRTTTAVMWLLKMATSITILITFPILTTTTIATTTTVMWFCKWQQVPVVFIRFKSSFTRSRKKRMNFFSFNFGITGNEENVTRFVLQQIKTTARPATTTTAKTATTTT